MTSSPKPVQVSKSVHLEYLRQTIELAKQSPPKPTNFRVGCVLVSYRTVTTTSPQIPRVLSTGYTLELPGNTHAEQCALAKLTLSNSVAEEDIHTVLTTEANVTLYTSLEPCGKRLSGNLPCVQRIIATRQRGGKETGIQKVVFGAKEPGTFVQDSQSCKLLTEAGVDWEYLPDLEQEILGVAMEGHVKDETPTEESTPRAKMEQKTNVEISGTDGGNHNEPNKKTVEEQPRNPKKRMMEAPPQPEG